MQKHIDITGTIYNGMWNYESPFTKINIKPLPPVDWVDYKVHCELFEGMHSQTGTYLETPAHVLGYDISYPLIDVEISKLIMIKCKILKLGELKPDSKRRALTKDELINAASKLKIEEGDTILISTGWGKYWYDDFYLEKGPYFTKEAMEWLISQKPFMLGTDLCRWENLDNLQGFFQDFYAADILMLGPLVNLECIDASSGYLTVLPLKIAGTCCCPCRVVFTYK